MAYLIHVMENSHEIDGDEIGKGFTCSGYESNRKFGRGFNTKATEIATTRTMWWRWSVDLVLDRRAGVYCGARWCVTDCAKIAPLQAPGSDHHNSFTTVCAESLR